MSDFVTNSAICRPSDRSKPRSSVRRRRQIINRMAEFISNSAIVESGAYAHPRAAPLLDAGAGPADPGRHARQPWLFARLTG